MKPGVTILSASRSRRSPVRPVVAREGLEPSRVEIRERGPLAVPRQQSDAPLFRAAARAAQLEAGHVIGARATPVAGDFAPPLGVVAEEEEPRPRQVQKRRQLLAAAV